MCIRYENAQDQCSCNLEELLAEPAAGRVSIGGASVALVNPKDWFSVPDGIGKALPPTEEILRHLKWMIEKDNLGQDMFLIGFARSFYFLPLNDQTPWSGAEMARLPVLRTDATRS